MEALAASNSRAADGAAKSMRRFSLIGCRRSKKTSGTQASQASRTRSAAVMVNVSSTRCLFPFCAALLRCPLIPPVQSAHWAIRDLSSALPCSWSPLPLCPLSLPLYSVVRGYRSVRTTVSENERLVQRKQLQVCSKEGDAATLLISEAGAAQVGGCSADRLRAVRAASLTAIATTTDGCKRRSSNLTAACRRRMQSRELTAR